MLMSVAAWQGLCWLDSTQFDRFDRRLDKLGQHEWNVGRRGRFEVRILDATEENDD